MFISLIIPSLNTPTLPRTLSAVAQQTRLPDEILVVGRDDAGVLADFPAVRFVDTVRPVYPGVARNMGMAQARGDIFLFCDADCIPAADWVARHVARQAAGERVVGGSVALAGANYWAQSDNVSMFHEFTRWHPAGGRRLLPTLNLSVARGVYEAVGGMDDALRASEDADWTVRMRLAGYTLYFEPAAVVQHAPVRTRWRDVVRHWQYTGRDSIRVRLRYADVYKTPLVARSPLLLRLLSPLIAARVTATVYSRRPHWQYWASVPVVYATKVIYCWAAARALQKRP